MGPIPGMPSSSSAGAAPPTPHPPEATPKPADTPKSSRRAASMPPEHGVKLIEGKSESWWSKQNIQLIKTQAELRGHCFSDLDTKGGLVKKDGKMTKHKRISKADYLEVLTGLIAKGKK